jgi:transposase
MPRSLNARRLHPVEVRQLHSAMEKELTPRQRRRAEALVLHAAGLEAAEIARALDVHVNTTYSDLRAFEQHGVASVEHRLRGGPPARHRDTEVEIVRLAETSPAEMGLPYGRWSLSKLREYLFKRRVVKAISREHLRRVLRKGGCAFEVSNAS